MAGLKIMANVRVQALQDYTLRVKIDNAQLVTLNGEIEVTDANRIMENGGANSDSLRDNFPPEFKRHLETPILVNLKRGVVEEFFVAQDEPMSVTNIKIPAIPTSIGHFRIPTDYQPTRFLSQ